MWLKEAVETKHGRRVFSLCCSRGKVKLPPVKPPPTGLMRYFSGEHQHSAVFLKEIRRLNSSFAFASLEADEKHIEGQGTLRSVCMALCTM